MSHGLDAADWLRCLYPQSALFRVSCRNLGLLVILFFFFYLLSFASILVKILSVREKAE